MLVYLWGDVFRVFNEMILIFITRSAWGWRWKEDSGRRPLRVWTTPPWECDNHPVLWRQLYGHGVSWRLWWTWCRQGNMSSNKYLLKLGFNFYFVYVWSNQHMKLTHNCILNMSMKILFFNSEWHFKSVLYPFRHIHAQLWRLCTFCFNQKMFLYCRC